MSNIVKHGSWSPEAVAADVTEASKGSTDFFKPRVGQNVLRFLPPGVGSKSPFVVTYQHFIELADGKRVMFNCARMMVKARCPACERMDALLRTGTDADYKASWDFKAKLRVFSNIIDRDNPDGGVQAFGFGKSILDALVAIRQDARAGGDFTDSEQGFDIVVTKKGEGMRTEYAVLPDRNSSPLSNDTKEQESWLESTPELSRFLKVPSYEDALAKMQGETPAREPAPTRRTALPPTVERAAPRAVKLVSTVADNFDDEDL